MSLDPLFNTTTAIQIHMIAALGAFFLGAVVLWKKKGNKIHKLNGRIWVALMLVTSFSGFFIHEIQLWGNYSPIHIISALVPLGLAYAIYEARTGKIDAHQRSMKSTYIGGMIVAGGLTFLPGRLSHEMLFGDSDFDVFGQAGGWLVPIVLAGLVALYFSGRQQAKN